MDAVSGRRRLEILLVLASTALVFLPTEAAVRLFGLTEPRRSGHARVNTGRRSVRENNTRGYRDLERAQAKPAGARGLLSLGDSLAWGAGVEFEGRDG